VYPTPETDSQGLFSGELWKGGGCSVIEGELKSEQVLCRGIKAMREMISPNTTKKDQTPLS
jgi:hypothetical protein